MGQVSDCGDTGLPVAAESHTNALQNRDGDIWELTHFSDVLLIPQMHDLYKWDTVGK